MRPLLLVLLLTGSTLAQDYPARVVGVTDGDTLTVLTAEDKQVKIRLAGIDAPETGQDFGARSKQLASDLAFGKMVTIRPQTVDRYGRTVASVFLPDGRTLNHEMVGRGMAWWYRQYAPKDGALAGLETKARSSKLGLWSQPKPVAPWAWRPSKRTAKAEKIEDDEPQTIEAVQSGEAVVGNRRSHLYHRPNCRGAKTTKESRHVDFASKADAEAAGFKPARDCY